MDAERRVWERRQGGPLHSHVAPWMVRSSGPGYCSQVAGWRKCRLTTPGLVEPQELPIASRWCWPPSGGKRPFSATGGNTDRTALRGGGGKGVVIPSTSGEDGSGTGERECENCADRIRAMALKPHFHGLMSEGGNASSACGQPNWCRKSRGRPPSSAQRPRYSRIRRHGSVQVTLREVQSE